MAARSAQASPPRRSRGPEAHAARAGPRDGAAGRARSCSTAPPVGGRAPARAGGGPGRRVAAGPERLRLEEVSIHYGRQAGRQVGLAVDPPGRGAGADRALRLRQDDAAAHAQPAHRADAERVSRRAGAARRRGHPRARGHEAALARGDGLPAAQPVPDVDLRQRRLRAARTVAQAPAQARARAAGDRRAAAGRASTRRCARTSTVLRCGCQAASSSGCASPARSPRARRCC